MRFLGGTDDFSLKNVLAAEAARQPSAEFVNASAARFEKLAGPLDLSFDDFIRTSSDCRHAPAVEAAGLRDCPVAGPTITVQTMVEVREITYEADGRTMIGTLGLPDGDGKRPAVLIAHEGPGLDEYQKNRARQFAELGYVAFALDYNGGGRRLADSEMSDRLRALGEDVDRLRAVGKVGLDILLNEPRVDASKVAAIGYCTGGTLVLELARAGIDLKAVVALHATLTTSRPQDAANITGKVLVLTGADDPVVNAEQRSAFEAEMRSGGVDWSMVLYGRTMHAFTNPTIDQRNNPVLKYNPSASASALQAMLNLFDETLGKP